MSDVFRKFASVAQPEKYGFAFDSGSWQSNDRYPIESKFRMFETYGDGLTQHSGDWAVQYENLGDYLISLSVYMLAHKVDTELYDRIGYIVLSAPRLALIQFAATVVWNEKDEPFGKTRYYSLAEQKITRNQEKRHDKRFREIDKGCTGSAQSIFNILMSDKDYADGMERLCYAVAVKKFIDDQPTGWCDHPTTLLGWWNEDKNAHEKRVAVSYGFRAAQSLARSYQEMKIAENEIGNYTKNHLKQPEPQQQMALTDGSAETAA